MNKKLARFGENLLITGVALLVVTPVVAAVALPLRLALFLAESLWIAIGVPLFYGVGNLIRLLTGQSPVKAPIGLAQWLLRAAFIAACVVLPLAFIGVGAFSGTWLATNATPWLTWLFSGNIPGVDPAIMASIQLGVEIFNYAIIGIGLAMWMYACIPNKSALLDDTPFTQRFPQSMTRVIKAIFKLCCPTFKPEKSSTHIRTKNDFDLAATQSASSTDSLGEVTTPNASAKIWSTFYDKQYKQNIGSNYSEWAESLDCLTNGAISLPKRRLH